MHFFVKVGFFVISFIYFTVPNLCFASGVGLSISEKLVLADKSRSSNPEDFTLLVDELKERKLDMSLDEKDYLKYLIAYQLSFSGEFSKAVLIYKDLTLNSKNEILKFRANLSLVNTYAISKDWATGLEHLSTNLDLLPNIKEAEFKQLGILIAALFYNQLGQYELGLYYANQLDELVHEGRNACLAKQLAIEAKLKLGKLNERSSEIESATKICQQSGEHLIVAIIAGYTATNLISEEKVTQASNVLHSHLDAVNKINYPPVSSRYYSLLSQAYYLNDEIVKAESFAARALEKSISLGNNESTLEAYYILFQIAESRGEHQLALDYHKKYAAADKAYLDDVKTKHLAFQLAQHQATEQRNQIDLLDKQNNLLRVEQKLATTEAENNRLFISLLISIITLLGFWAYKSWKTQQRLKQLAEYDALTKVYNRGHFTHLAEDALKYCGSANIQLSCILFDLDKFKQINDNYGHGCGDWVLKQVAKVCQAQGRKNDIFARLGGEEFCMILPSCDLHTALKLAESCRVAINQIDTAPSGHDFTISASLGVTDTQLSGYSLEQLTTDADSAMYQSKDDGRNRISVYSPKGEQLSLDALSSARL